MGKTKDPEMFADLTTEELRRLGGVLHNGNLTAGAAAAIIGEYDTAMEAADIAIDLYATARQGGGPGRQARAASRG
jgi:hypothetical protein